MLKCLNAGEDPITVATDELLKWRLGNGEILPGLVRRRAPEVELFKTKSDEVAHLAPCRKKVRRR